MEIKEMLYKLDSISNGAYNNDGYVDLKQDEAKLLLDYITNLQQENEKWFAVAKDFEMEAHDLWNKNNELEDAQKNFEKQFIKEIDYKSRIEKAVEYIEHSKFIKEQVIMKNNYDMQDFQVKELLYILNGRSDE